MASDEETRKSRVVVEIGTESNPSLIRWSTMWGRYSPFESYVLCTTDGWVLIDPEEPDAQTKDRLSQLITEVPIATVLTSDGHERSCYDVREKWGIPIWGPEYSPAARDIAYDGEPDHLYKEGQTLPGGLKPLKLQGAWGGDHALLWTAPEGQNLVFTGDVLNGQVEITLAQPDHYRNSPGLAFGSRPGYLDRHGNLEGIKQCLHRLLEEEIDAICGAHGTPHWKNPKEEIARLIGTL
jgi:glyoxylase-like metal-dependent hydrolase (beta-lactamase superfamily II)